MFVSLDEELEEELPLVSLLVLELVSEETSPLVLEEVSDVEVLLELSLEFGVTQEDKSDSIASDISIIFFIFMFIPS
ncbi:MAG TPA: hypothetical protein PKK21_04715 [Bacilli bacterium]|nr:hypothetical protein [Bacilli bacterium]